LEQQVHLLQVQIDSERQLRAAAERNADDLRMSLRMIEASPASSLPSPTAAISDESRPKRWWTRRANR
ncbi:hypothetical protein, partial [Subtercola boreus]|uniref:hypothetical protein n=1 Tax=Subtercola boreus TaxID=120213 RepID=UPI001C0F1F77